MSVRKRLRNFRVEKLDKKCFLDTQSWFPFLSSTWTSYVPSIIRLCNWHMVCRLHSGWTLTQLYRIGRISLENIRLCLSATNERISNKILVPRRLMLPSIPLPINRIKWDGGLTPRSIGKDTRDIGLAKYWKWLCVH